MHAKRKFISSIYREYFLLNESITFMNLVCRSANTAGFFKGCPAAL
ncbi:hypothetical protein KIS4809_1845 [Bacillus sp. ZZV12-4809]|nr:hypothetical protein KIS4809_1845 [Bacillus sp. ZZV12-4809]